MQPSVVFIRALRLERPTSPGNLGFSRPPGRALLPLNGPYRYNLRLTTTAFRKYKYGHIFVYRDFYMWPFRLTRQDLLEWYPD